MAADVVLRAVGVEGDLGAVEDDQQRLLVGLETGQQAVQGGGAGAGRKERLEAPDELGSSAAGLALVVLEVAIEPPEALLNARLGAAIDTSVTGVELLNQALGMNPAGRVGADVELAGVVAEDAAAGEPAVGAPERPFGGDLERLRIDLEAGDPERRQMRLPSLLVFEVPGLGRGQAGAAGPPARSHALPYRPRPHR